MRSTAQPFAVWLRGDSASADRPASASADGDAAAAGGHSRIWPAVVGCLVLAALSLLLPSTPTYDPWAWILWGREIAHLDLVTSTGPSWKPLPVLFTVPFSLFGDYAAPLLWVWIARAGGLLALVMVFRIARRLVGGIPGIVAGVLGAAFMLVSFQFMRNAALGNSEPLLAALVLLAFERFVDGRRDHALYLGLGAALLRPEVWPFLGLYGLWLLLREPALRWRVVAVFAAIPVLWFGPELWGSGDALRASSRANNPNPGTVAFADNPGLEVAHRFVKAAIWPLFVGVVAAVGYSLWAFVRGRGREHALTLTVAAAGLSWLLLVCGMTEGGYAGNPRYLIVTTGALCVLAGVGFGRLFQGLVAVSARVLGDGPRAVAAAFAVVALCMLPAAGVIETRIENGRTTIDQLRYQASLWNELRDVVDEVGGRDRVLRCGSVFSGPYQTQMVAWVLGIHGRQVTWRAKGPKTEPPGIVFQTRSTPNSPLIVEPDDPRFAKVASNSRWNVLSVPPEGRSGNACPAAPGAPRAPSRPDTPKLTAGSGG